MTKNGCGNPVVKEWTKHFFLSRKITNYGSHPLNLMFVLNNKSWPWYLLNPVLKRCQKKNFAMRDQRLLSEKIQTHEIIPSINFQCDVRISVFETQENISKKPPGKHTWRVTMNQCRDQTSSQLVVLLLLLD